VKRSIEFEASLRAGELCPILSHFLTVAFPQNSVSWHIILRPVGGMSHHLFKWDLGFKQV
jgi:hypothetical protein